MIKHTRLLLQHYLARSRARRLTDIKIITIIFINNINFGNITNHLIHNIYIILKINGVREKKQNTERGLCEELVVHRYIYIFMHL